MQREGVVKASWSERIRNLLLAISDHPRTVRWILAGPVTIISSILVMAGMALWIPAGEARINNIALPVVLLPVIWAVFFFYTCIDENILRMTLVMAIIILAHIVLLVSAF